jgi:hypothetical protein
VHDEPLAGIPLAGHGETGEAQACVGAHSPRLGCLSDYDAATVSDSLRGDPAGHEHW